MRTSNMYQYRHNIVDRAYFNDLFRYLPNLSVLRITYVVHKNAGHEICKQCVFFFEMIYELKLCSMYTIESFYLIETK